MAISGSKAAEARVVVCLVLDAVLCRVNVWTVAESKGGPVTYCAIFGHMPKEKRGELEERKGYHLASNSNSV